ncbi:hypothetical protein INR49_001934, partial [Caranx melampygus]
IFYLPMALAVPPSIFAVHLQLNLLYQFWIHTELIRDLGPLEWVFNTPKHHRVHHGTFALETEKVVYGLVYPINTFEILYVQVTGKEVPHDPSWSLPLQVYVVLHFLLVLRSYHDLFEDKTETPGFQLLTRSQGLSLEKMLSQLTILGMTSYILLTLTSLGFIIDQRPTAGILEMLRCVVMVTMQRYSFVKPLLPSLAVPTE